MFLFSGGHSSLYWLPELLYMCTLGALVMTLRRLGWERTWWLFLQCIFNCSMRGGRGHKVDSNTAMLAICLSAGSRNWRHRYYETAMMTNWT